MSLTKNSLYFTLGTLLSRIAGLIREREVGAVFGASALDVFTVAFRIPNLFRDMLAEGALGAAFTKVYAATSVDDQKRADRLMVEVLIATSALATIVTVLGIIFAPLFVHSLSLFGSLEKRGGQAFIDECIYLTRWLFPYLGLTMLSAVVMGALHKQGKMLLSAASPIIFNICMILGAIFFVTWFSQGNNTGQLQFLKNPTLMGLVVGVLLGGFLQILAQLLGLYSSLIKFFNQPTKIKIFSPELKKILVLMFPMMIAASSAQINVVINTNFAISLESGAVTWLSYAFRLLHLPIALFGVAIGVALLPALSKSIRQAGDRITESVNKQMQNAFEIMFWLMLPCTAFLLWNSDAIVNVLYGKGAFAGNDVKQTALALRAYSWSALGYGLIKVLTAFYFSIDKTKFAMYVSLGGIGLNILANILLVPKYGFEGIAYATSILLSVNALILLLGCFHYGISFNNKNLIRAGIFLILATTIYYFVNYFAQSILNATYQDTEAFSHNLISILLSGIIACAVFLLAMLARFQAKPMQLLGSFRNK
ncbi:MAG: murein biosynthesis integral membrane protein MurJ [Oligoflexales bacterium]|nr:murein biosynthesis integral membrane protein MurJ [Oligoflexales bacterium]